MNHKLICYYTPLIRPTDVFTSAKAGGYVSSGVCLSVSNFTRKYFMKILQEMDALSWQGSHHYIFSHPNLNTDLAFFFNYRALACARTHSAILSHLLVHPAVPCRLCIGTIVHIVKLFTCDMKKLRQSSLSFIALLAKSVTNTAISLLLSYQGFQWR